ncbi:unnamed protein product [Trichogramma brassicae]|uniref:Uncharacterized protein n=1 Tax=Trichogramma brassicae TaxID=86971 RepID=A0A6H5IZI8_9HYME|nr:unnamed protein product [Trichogramma brassicae]
MKIHRDISRNDPRAKSKKSTRSCRALQIRPLDEAIRWRTPTPRGYTRITQRDLPHTRSHTLRVQTLTKTRVVSRTRYASTTLEVILSCKLRIRLKSDCLHNRSTTPDPSARSSARGRLSLPPLCDPHASRPFGAPQTARPKRVLLQM